jgi:hypothetical protein
MNKAFFWVVALSWFTLRAMAQATMPSPIDSMASHTGMILKKL